MDSYQRYRSILFNRLGFIGWLIGYQILENEKKINFYTIAVAIYLTLTMPFMMIWSAIFSEGELAQKAMGYAPIGFQVNPIFTVLYHFLMK